MVSNIPTFSCIITAAGSGVRFSEGVKKQFTLLQGKPILYYAIDLFYNVRVISEIIITLPIGDFAVESQKIKQAFPQKLLCIEGGETRQKSVLKALEYCNHKNDFVLVHDAVRPFFRYSDLDAMVQLLGQHNAVIPACRVKNTVKQVNGDLVKGTIPRDDLIEVFTPQMFKLATIKELHQRAALVDNIFTDDASIFEYYNEPVNWFQASSPNFKITTPEDLQYAEYLLSRGTDYV